MTGKKGARRHEIRSHITDQIAERDMQSTQIFDTGR